MSNSPDRIVLQSTPIDRDNLSVIAAGLRSADRPFPTRSDCVRHSLAMMAAALAAPALSNGHTRKVAPTEIKKA